MEALRVGSDDTRSEALGRLVELYWPPIYAYLRRSGLPSEDAAETTQAFFTDVVLQRKLFQRADAERGRLRTLLLTALRNYLRDGHRRHEARGGHGMSLTDLQREEVVAPEIAQLNPEQAFDRRWAMATLEEALARSREHFASKPAHWKAFEARVLRPSIAAVEPPPLARVADELGFRTPADAASAVQVVRKRTAALLLEVVGETVADPEARDDEYRLVLALLT